MASAAWLAEREQWGLAKKVQRKMVQELLL